MIRTHSQMSFLTWFCNFCLLFKVKYEFSTDEVECGFSSQLMEDCYVPPRKEVGYEIHLMNPSFLKEVKPEHYGKN